MRMRIGGLQKLTLVDFPGKVAATVFVQGCNFRCCFCHNAPLVLPQLFQEPLSPDEVFNYLNTRRGKLGGVVISGGEPTLQQDLADFIVRVKEMGFAVKLDTNGSRPDVLRSLIGSNLLDYIAMDIKTSLPKYVKLAGLDCDPTKIKESIDIIIKSGIPYQFRTTLIKEFCSADDLSDIRFLIGKANHYVLQPFVSSGKMVNPQLDYQDQYTDEQVQALKAKYDVVAGL